MAYYLMQQVFQDYTSPAHNALFPISLEIYLTRSYISVRYLWGKSYLPFSNQATDNLMNLFKVIPKSSSNNSTNIQGMLWGLNELIFVNCLEQYLVLDELYISICLMNKQVNGRYTQADKFQIQVMNFRETKFDIFYVSCSLLFKVSV